MSSSTPRPGAILTLVAVVAGLIDLGFALFITWHSLFAHGSDRSLGLLVGGGALGLVMLSALAIEQSARRRHVLAWLAVIPPVLAAQALVTGGW